MKYKDLIRTIEIVSKYNGGLDANCLEMWAAHDEHGITFPNRKFDGKVDASDLRELLSMGWCFGSDGVCDEETWEKLEKYEKLSDEELLEIFGDLNGIYKYE